MEKADKEVKYSTSSYVTQHSYLPGDGPPMSSDSSLHPPSSGILMNLLNPGSNMSRHTAGQTVMSDRRETAGMQSQAGGTDIEGKGGRTSQNVGMDSSRESNMRGEGNGYGYGYAKNMNPSGDRFAAKGMGNGENVFMSQLGLTGRPPPNNSYSGVAQDSGGCGGVEPNVFNDVSSQHLPAERTPTALSKPGPAYIPLDNESNYVYFNPSVGPLSSSTPANAPPDWNHARSNMPFQQVTAANIKKEPDMTDSTNLPAACDWERNVQNEIRPSSVKVEDAAATPQTDSGIQAGNEKHFEKTFPSSEMNSVNAHNRGPPCNMTGNASPFCPPTPATDQTSGPNKSANITDSAYGSSSRPMRACRRTRSSSNPFVVTPSLYSDSSDSEQDEESGKSQSDTSSVPARASVKFIKQEPQQSDSSDTEEQSPVQSPSQKSRTSSLKKAGKVDKEKSSSQPKIPPLKISRAKLIKQSSSALKGAGKSGDKLDGKTCPVCKKTFTRPESLTIHMRVHTGDRPYKCQHCDATYKIAGHLRDHVRSKHSTSRPYLCTKCGKDFSYPTARRRHEKSCGKELSDRIEFKCTTCDKGFVTAKGFAKHQNTCGSSSQGDSTEKDKNMPFKCNNCDKAFATAPGLERHQRFICGKVPPKEVYTCEECGKSYQKRDRYIAHTRHHTGEKPFKCTLCDMQFYDQGSLKKHLNRHEENRKYRCSMCDAGFYEKQTLSVHVMRVHCGLKPFKCNECDADLSSAYQLSRHIRNLHRNERPFKCMLCGKEFFDAKPYKKHMHKHTLQLTNPMALLPKKPKQHTCNECGQSFFWRALGAHVAAEHPGKSLSDVLTTKVLKCDICAKEFSCQQTLRVHKRGHTSVKRFKCDKCDRQFAVLSALRFHSSKHSEDRPHCCQECGKTFRWLSNLTYHRMAHHTPKPDYADVNIENYVCNECGREFRRENFLYLHLKLKRHGQGTPCICSQCGRGFTDVDDFKSHMSTHDSITAKPFICSICGAGFYYQHLLDRHNKQRHAQQCTKTSWLCEECGKYFTRKVYLQKHMARHARYPQGKIPPAGRPRKNSRSPEPMQQHSPEYIPDAETQNCGIQTEADAEVHSGLQETPYMAPTVNNEPPRDGSEGPPLPNELSNISLFELQNYQSHFSTFIHQTLAWPKPDEQ